jgi:hypothetical protein
MKNISDVGTTVKSGTPRIALRAGGGRRRTGREPQPREDARFLLVGVELMFSSRRPAEKACRYHLTVAGLGFDRTGMTVDSKKPGDPPHRGIRGLGWGEPGGSAPQSQARTGAHRAVYGRALARRPWPLRTRRPARALGRRGGHCSGLAGPRATHAARRSFPGSASTSS